jgi:hypothetical protein
MNFDEAKNYIYNRYKNSFRYVDDAFMYKHYYVFNFSCNYMTPFVFKVTKDNLIKWGSECDKEMNISYRDSDDVIECKLKKIEKYIDDELKTIYEINKKNLIQKLNNL